MVAACGCGGGSSSPTTGSGTSASSASGPVTVLSPTEKLVDVGAYSLILHCEGTGSPTVVFENGFEGIESDWETVRQSSDKLPRACSYDRAGTGSSDATPSGRVSAGDSAHDLATLLERAGEKPPFVLVGWSWGGLIDRIFQHRYPDQVAGLVLVESSGGPIPGDTGDKAGHATIDLAKSYRQLAATGSVGHLPLVELTAAHDEDMFSPAALAQWAKYQQAMSHLSTNEVHVLATQSDHAVLSNQPLLVDQAITDVENSVRTGKPIPACDRRYTKIQGRCLS
jgi:pimeloyl-ACP methyl ester carboxylesterase